MSANIDRRQVNGPLDFGDGLLMSPSLGSWALRLFSLLWILLAFESIGLEGPTIPSCPFVGREEKQCWFALPTSFSRNNVAEVFQSFIVDSM